MVKPLIVMRMSSAQPAGICMWKCVKIGHERALAVCDEDGLPPKLLALIASGAAWAMALQEARGGVRR